MPTKEQLKELQALSLEEKIQISTARIIEWYETWGGQVYVSFSGGKDSTVLLDLVRRIYPDVSAVFFDTGLEFPEIREFVKTVDNVTWIKPKMNFVEVIKKYGYPMISKEVSRDVEVAIHKPQGKTAEKFNNDSDYVKKYGERYCLAKYSYLLHTDFNISNKCCNIMKKLCAHQYIKQYNAYPFVGTMANESNLRKQIWLQKGCNAFNNKNPQSAPLSFWTEQDILKYIQHYKLNYASIYGDLIKKGNKLVFTGRNRTGCVFCGFGCTVEKNPNRYQQLAITHPHLYDYCMRGGKFDETGHWIPNKGLGMAKVLDAINVKWWNTEEERDKYRKEYQEKEKEYYNKSEER